MKPFASWGMASDSDGLADHEPLDGSEDLSNAVPRAPSRTEREFYR
jgi:hypothetical protein